MRFLFEIEKSIENKLVKKIKNAIRKVQKMKATEKQNTIKRVLDENNLTAEELGMPHNYQDG